jgi:hypothetical protein
MDRGKYDNLDRIQKEVDDHNLKYQGLQLQLMIKKDLDSIKDEHKNVKNLLESIKFISKQLRK